MSEEKFRQAIEKYARELEWEIAEIEDDRVVFEFEMESGNELSVYLDYDEDMLIFSVPSIAVYDAEEDINDRVSTLLLKRNAEVETGFWALEELEEGWGYVLYHDQKLSSGEFEQDLDSETFRNIIEAMLDECEEFNQIWEEEDF